MGKFKVNGVDLEYDILDLDEMERYFDVTDRITEELQVKGKDETPVDRLRRACQSVLDGFDELFGDGTARAVFGDHIRVDDVMIGYTTMVNAMNDGLRDGTASIDAVMHSPPRNRAERRAASKPADRRAGGK